jgi:hypothetical protein
MVFEKPTCCFVSDETTCAKKVAFFGRSFASSVCRKLFYTIFFMFSHSSSTLCTIPTKGETCNSLLSPRHGIVLKSANMATFAKGYLPNGWESGLENKHQNDQSYIFIPCRGISTRFPYGEQPFLRSHVKRFKVTAREYIKTWFCLQFSTPPKIITSPPP